MVIDFGIPFLPSSLPSPLYCMKSVTFYSSITWKAVTCWLLGSVDVHHKTNQDADRLYNDDRLRWKTIASWQIIAIIDFRQDDLVRPWPAFRPLYFLRNCFLYKVTIKRLLDILSPSVAYTFLHSILLRSLFSSGSRSRGDQTVPTYVFQMIRPNYVGPYSLVETYECHQTYEHKEKGVGYTEQK